MRKNKVLDLFNKKGYCIIRDIDTRFNKADFMESQKTLISQLEDELNNISYDKIKFINDNGEDKLDPYIIYYDTSKVEIQIIQSLNTYVESIIKINQQIENQNANDKKNSYTYYRGHSSWRYIHQPSIYREGNEKLLENEDRIFRDIISSKPHFFNDCNTTLDMLVKMQHYGIPTRLLDLTDNPLISLFFACNANDDEDKGIHGEVTVFNVPQEKFKYYDSDTVSVLSNIVKCNKDFDISGFSFCEGIDWIKLVGYYAPNKQEKISEYQEKKVIEFNNIKVISELVHFIREDKPYFLPRVVPIHLDNFSIVVKPKMAIDRIINQSGAFVLFGIKKSKNICADFNINTEGYKQKVLIIPSIFKKQIIRELKLLNINESTVFCDFDSTANFFKDKYK